MIQGMTRLCSVILLLMVLSGCAFFPSARIPSAPVPIETLLLHSAAYPSGWSEENKEHNGDFVGDDVENITVVFRYRSEETGISVHTVLYYRSPQEAQQGFKALLQDDDMHYRDIAESSELSFHSQKAQQLSVRCSHRLYSPTKLPLLCIVVAQYRSYVSVFSAPLDDRLMSRSTFLHLLSEIDTQMPTMNEQTPNNNVGSR